MRKGFIIGVLVLILFAIPAMIWGHRDIPVEELKSRYANASSRFAPIEGMSVHYRVEGNESDSIPLLLLHGTGASLHTWDGWVNEMKASRKLIRLDLPAFGLTGPSPSRKYDLDLYYQVVIQLLDHLGVGKVDIAGNSLGGCVAWYTALQSPGRVRKLVLIDAVGYPFERSDQPIAFRMARIPVVNRALTYFTPRSVVESSLSNLYSDRSKVTPELIDRYFDLALREGNRQAFVDRAAYQELDSSYLRMAEITQPTLLLWGEQDTFVPISMAHAFERDLPNDTLVIVPHSGHMPMEELPVETAEIVLHFLK